MPTPDPEKLVPRNRQLALRLARSVAAGKSLRAAAEELEVPYSRAKAWNRSAAFRRQVERCQSEWGREASGILAGACTAAANELLRLMRESKDDAIRLRAARAILERVPGVSDPLPPKPLAEMSDEELERYAATGSI